MTATAVGPSILDLIEREAGLRYRKAAATGGGEWAGPCPWCGGADRFHIWPARGRYWCRQCDRKGDAIQFVRDYRGLGFTAAREYVGVQSYVKLHPSNPGAREGSREEPQGPPGEPWQGMGRAFVRECYAALRSPQGARALAWLHRRGLADETLHLAGIGYNSADRWADREAWGLPSEVRKDGRPKGLWLPRGVVIPWIVAGELWGVSIRRPAGEPKYYWLPGGVRGLYHATKLVPGRPAVLVEGELDACSIAQALGHDLAAVVATGSTHGGRQVRWLARLAACSVVLVAFDADQAGEEAAAWWLDALPNARRWRPYWSDANAMAQDGADLRAWVQAGLTRLV